GNECRRNVLPGNPARRRIEPPESAAPAPADLRNLALVPRPAVTGDEPPHPSRASQRGLDWFIFFLADVQTGFGPFVAVYLTSQKWTQVEIGLVLSIGGIVGLI